MSDIVKVSLLLPITFLIVAISVLFVSGVRDGKYPVCREEWVRYEYIIPVYRWGCWVGDVP